MPAKSTRDKLLTGLADLSPPLLFLMNGRALVVAKVLATALEPLAFAILLGVIAFAVGSASALIVWNWRSTETFYELIYRTVLLVIMGVELIRTLLTHDLFAILELLAFVVARKMLKPRLPTLDILLGVAAFVVLLAARRFLLPPSRVRRREYGTDAPPTRKGASLHRAPGARRDFARPPQLWPRSCRAFP